MDHITSASVLGITRESTMGGPVNDYFFGGSYLIGALCMQEYACLQDIFRYITAHRTTALSAESMHMHARVRVSLFSSANM